MTKPYSERSIYLDMAAYFRRHGFSPSLYMGPGDAPTCFIGAAPTGLAYIPILEQIVGAFGEDTLRRNGWTERDAIAVCEIAADLAAP